MGNLCLTNVVPPFLEIIDGKPLFDQCREVPSERNKRLKTVTDNDIITDKCGLE